MFSGFSSFDYGWGTLANALPQFTVRTFDPAIPGLDTPPEPHDLFISTDLLERVEPEFVDVVIDDLERLTNRTPFHQVGTSSDQRQAGVPSAPGCWRFMSISKQSDGLADKTNTQC